MKTNDVTRLDDRRILAERVLDAPRELVFEVWTDPAHLAQWFGPAGFTLTTREAAMKPGGAWRFVMHGPDGRDYDNVITFLEIDPPSRLVYEQGGENETAGVHFRVEVLFGDEGGRTRLVMSMLFPSNEARDHVVEAYGAFEGLKECMARLRDHVARQAVPAGEPAERNGGGR